MEQKYANDLNYGHLRYFYAVASEGGLRQASAKLHVSQSSICTQIRQL
jgi:LysR family transcriptional activator of nhaA